jgi:hypothetical protein
VAVLAAKFRLVLAVLAARFGGRFCGPDGPVATFGNSAETRINQSGDVSKHSVISCNGVICKDLMHLVESVVEFAAEVC